MILPVVGLWEIEILRVWDKTCQIILNFKNCCSIQQRQARQLKLILKEKVNLLYRTTLLSFKQLVMVIDLVTLFFHLHNCSKNARVCQ